MRKKLATGNKKKIIIILFLTVFGFFLFNGAKYIPFFWQLFFNKDIQLKKTDNRINVLLLGIGGGTHEGPDLTDTIIFASIDPLKNTVSLISIPRDLWVPDLKAKINTAYAIGEENKKGGGLLLAKASIEKIIHQNVDYAVRVDFNGFVKAVDMVGGLDIIVDKSFDDFEYPIEGKEDDPCGHTTDELQSLATASSQLDAFPCRYEHLHFNAGPMHMDGAAGLKFVRSRHAQGSEGSDFARSKRQEKVIAAFKEKLFSAQTILNPIKIANLINVLKDSIDTDIKQDELDDFVRLAEKMKHAKLQSSVLDTGDEAENRQGLLIHPDISDEYNNEWVLIPKAGNGDFSEIQAYIACQVENKGCLTPTPSIVPLKK